MTDLCLRFYDLSDSEEEEDGTKKAIHCKGKKEKGILEGKNKEKKHEKANKIKNEQKERNIITKKSGEESCTANPTYFKNNVCYCSKLD